MPNCSQGPPECKKEGHIGSVSLTDIENSLGFIDFDSTVQWGLSTSTVLRLYRHRISVRFIDIDSSVYFIDIDCFVGFIDTGSEVGLIEIDSYVFLHGQSFWALSSSSTAL